jgi:predicted phage terminase large subunit-like protein
MFFGRIVNTVRYWDLASSKKSSADNTAGVRMHSTTEGYRIITDLRHGRYTPAERDRLIVNTAKRDKAITFIRTEEEGGSSGKSVTAHYAKLLAGYSYRGDRPGVDKWSRAQSFASYAQNGFVIILVAEWMEKFFDELEAFPNGNHDDIVDACSGAHNELSKLDGAFSVPSIRVASAQDEDVNVKFEEGSVLKSIIDQIPQARYDG